MWLYDAAGRDSKTDTKAYGAREVFRMNDKTSRRGFLKFLGKGGAVGAALAVPGSSYAIGVDAATKGEPRTELAFNFTCACGRSLIAEVPKKAGTVVDVRCECRREWYMRWEGDHFQTFNPDDCGAFDPYGRRQVSQAFADEPMEETFGPDGKPTKVIAK